VASEVIAYYRALLGDFPFPEFFSEDLDNVVLTPVGAPDAGSTMALMGLGMGALVSVRRKVRA